MPQVRVLTLDANLGKSLKASASNNEACGSYVRPPQLELSLDQLRDKPQCKGSVVAEIFAWRDGPSSIGEEPGESASERVLLLHQTLMLRLSFAVNTSRRQRRIQQKLRRGIRRR
jgi:hypothetical protein